MAVLYVVLVIVNHIICAWHGFALGPQDVILTQQLNSHLCIFERCCKWSQICSVIIH